METNKKLSLIFGILGGSICIITGLSSITLIFSILQGGLAFYAAFLTKSKPRTSGFIFIATCLVSLFFLLMGFGNMHLFSLLLLIVASIFSLLKD